MDLNSDIRKLVSFIIKEALDKANEIQLVTEEKFQVKKANLLGSRMTSLNYEKDKILLIDEFKMFII